MLNGLISASIMTFIVPDRCGDAKKREFAIRRSSLRNNRGFPSPSPCAANYLKCIVG